MTLHFLKDLVFFLPKGNKISGLKRNAAHVNDAIDFLNTN